MIFNENNTIVNVVGDVQNEGELTTIYLGHHESSDRNNYGNLFITKC